MDSIENELVKKAADMPDVDSHFKAASDFNELKEQVQKLETICHALWIMLNQKGHTNEEFDNAIAEVIERDKSCGMMLKGLRCPNCGKNAQLSKFFKIKCIYCGTEAIIHPYEVYDMFGLAGEQEAARIAEGEEQARRATGTGYAIEEHIPYDVTKDLNFEDL